MNETRHATLRDYVRIVRPDHWIKNLLILPGFLAAVVLLKPHPVLDGRTWGLLALALVCTSLVASANYAINEWLDAKFDRFHPTKKNRPVVVADLKKGPVYLEYAILAVAGLGLSPLLGAFVEMPWLSVFTSKELISIR